MDTVNLVYLIFWILFFLLAIYLFIKYKNRRAEVKEPLSWRFEILHVLGIIFMPVIECLILWAGFDDLRDRHPHRRE